MDQRAFLGRQRPGGETLVQHLAEGEAFVGIGYATAGKLWEAFGAELYALLGNGDVGRLAEVLGTERATALADAWSEKLAEGDVVIWLDENYFDRRLAKKIIRLWGDQAAAKLRAQPYVMMALADWPTVDAAAQSIGVDANSPERLVAAVEAVLYARLAHHHTWTDHGVLAKDVRKLLRCSRGRAEEAISLAVADRAALQTKDGFQAAGAHMMERYVCDRVRAMLANPVMGDVIAREVTTDDIQAWIERSGRVLGVELDPEQREAVRIGLQERCGIIRGGAGVGKTTVLKAIAAGCEHFGRVVHMMALAGRAAARIRETTGRQARTIAAFLKAAESNSVVLGRESLVVVDEASMLDLPTMYRILRHLPEGCRLLLVGDPGQLPPIGFGLVLHALIEYPEISSIELVRVYRQTESTSIPAVAKSVRAGVVPHLLGAFSRDTRGVVLIPNADNLSTDDLVEVVSQLGGFSEEVRILSALKGGSVGAVAINNRFHEILAVGKVRHPTRPFAEGEPVMFLRNDYQRNLCNGTLGRVAAIEGTSIVVDFDGVKHEFSKFALDDLTLAYAITVHKSQGSSFRQVIIPIQRTRLLDRSFVYTAITRAVDLAIVIADPDVLRDAVARPAHAERRDTALLQFFQGARSVNV
jgi:exodeoxyribonuclease V alpha subunit